MITSVSRNLYYPIFLYLGIINTTQPYMYKQFISFGAQFIDTACHHSLMNAFKEQVQFTWVIFVALIWIQNF